MFLWNICPTLINETIFTNNNVVKNGGIAYITELMPPVGTF